MSKRKQGENVESDDEDAPRGGMKTSTKVVLVAAGWVLLTLFLVGQFSEDPEDPSATARLDTVAGESVDLDGDGVIDEVVEEEATDVNGDGIIEIGEGVEEGVATASGADGGSEGSDGSGASGEGGAGSSGSESGSYQATPTESGGANAVPGAAPSSGGSTSGGSTATTTRSGSSPTTTAGSGSSGGSSTTSTTRPPTTTTGGGGGGATSSTTTTTTTTTTAGGGGSPPPPGNSAIILIVKARNEAYEYPSGYSANLQLSTGSQIRFDNIESTGVRHSFTIPAVWDSGEIKSDQGTRTSPALSPGTYTYTCTKHPTTMRGTITVS